MRNKVGLIAFAVFCQCCVLSAQTAINVLKDEQKKFVSELKSNSVDTVMVHSLIRSFESDADRFYKALMTDTVISAAKKEKALWSMGYLVKELNKQIAIRKLDIYDIPGTMQSYRSILMALLQYKPWRHMLIPLKPGRVQLLAAAFNQFDEYPLINDIVVYKRVASSPEFILQFLEHNPKFRFADSLLLDAVAYDPLKLVYYLNGNKSGIQQKIRSSKNRYLQQIVSISTHKNVSELVPFIAQLTRNEITVEEILQSRTNTVDYFQLLVNTQLATNYSRDASSVLATLIRDGIRQKSLAFYVNQINDLHDAPDVKRFASVKGLRPEDIYYIITTCGDELYTSSYLGLYKRLMEQFSPEGRDSLFDQVRYDNFHVFMRLAANYNVLADFLSTMPGEKTGQLVRRFVTGIGDDSGTGLERAMDIGDSFSGLSTAAGLKDVFQSELRTNFNQCKSASNYLGMRLYSILLQVFELSGQDNSSSKLWATLGDYHQLKRNALTNKKGEVVQVMLFYGDEDGVASFNNFTKLYTDVAKWTVSKNNNWITINSVIDPSFVIYANMPLDMKEDLDILAQDSLFDFLSKQSLEPTILVHRGHSYHLEKTLKRLTPSVRLAILGSCGSYNKAISIASMNPDAQVIGSKKTGTGSVNNPIIDAINETLINKKDLYWPEIWDKLTARFSKDEKELRFFNEYFPPSKNVGLFVLKLFMHYNRFATGEKSQLVLR